MFYLHASQRGFQNKRDIHNPADDFTVYQLIKTEACFLNFKMNISLIHFVYIFD